MMLAFWGIKILPPKYLSILKRTSMLDFSQLYLRDAVVNTVV